MPLGQGVGCGQLRPARTDEREVVNGHAPVNQMRWALIQGFSDDGRHRLSL